MQKVVPTTARLCLLVLGDLKVCLIATRMHLIRATERPPVVFSVIKSHATCPALLVAFHITTLVDYVFTWICTWLDAAIFFFDENGHPACTQPKINTIYNAKWPKKSNYCKKKNSIVLTRRKLDAPLRFTLDLLPVHKREGKKTRVGRKNPKSTEIATQRNTQHKKKGKQQRIITFQPRWQGGKN